MTIESTPKQGGASSHQEGGDHYAKMQEDMQPWNVLSHWLTPEEYRGYQKGVAIAYLAREASKGGNMDIRKAIHHLQRLVEEFPAHQETSSAKKSLDSPVVELPASMRCGDAINVPPLKEEKPWYPDDGDWKEVHDSTMKIPEALNGSDKVDVLLKSERLSERHESWHKHARNWTWNAPSGANDRIVAYKVV